MQPVAATRRPNAGHVPVTWTPHLNEAMDRPAGSFIRKELYCIWIFLKKTSKSAKKCTDEINKTVSGQPAKHTRRRR